MKKNVIIIALIVLIVVVLISYFYKRTGAAQEKLSPPTPVQVQKIITQDVPVYIDSFGSFAASQNVDISFQVSGYVEKVFFKKGSFVKKGDILISLNAETYDAALKEDMAILESAVADLNLKKFYVEKNKLLEKKGALASQDYEEMKIDLLKAIAKVKEDEARILQDKLNIRYCSLYSPIDGIIGLTTVGEGNLINHAVAPTVANIKAIDPLFFNFTISANDLARIEKAFSKGPLPLTVYVNEKTDEERLKETEYKGELKYLNNTANGDSGTVSLQAIVPNKNKTLLPGQFAKAKLLAANKKNAALVPLGAVKQGPNGTYVFIVDNESKARMIEITVGQEYNNFYIVEHGNLKAGDRVIMTGTLDLFSGSPVTATTTN